MRRGAALLGTMLWLCACGSGEEPAAPAAPSAPAAPTQSQPATPSPAAPAAAPQPAPAQPASAPVAGEGGSLRGDADKGAGLYVQYCATCHGQSGKGDGPVGVTLNPRPADHTNAEYIGTLSDERLYLVIEKGGMAVGKSPLMAAWAGVLKPEDIRDLVAYIRRLSST